MVVGLPDESSVALLVSHNKRVADLLNQERLRPSQRDILNHNPELSHINSVPS
jgi:hypothetical protein